MNWTISFKPAVAAAAVSVFGACASVCAQEADAAETPAAEKPADKSLLPEHLRRFGTVKAVLPANICDFQIRSIQRHMPI